MSTCCNKCQTCQACTNRCGQPYLCNVGENYCQSGRVPEAATANGFPAAEAPTFSRDQIIYKVFPQSELNRWIQYVKDAGKWDEGSNGAGTGNGPSAPNLSCGKEDRDFVYADKINKLISIMSQLSYKNNPNLEFERDDIIYADDFNKITKKLNALQLNGNGCRQCIGSCNVICNVCQPCISSCQSTCCCTV